jgi:hypothetical protein
MNNIELNHIDLNSIGLNSKTIDGIGKSHGGKVKPYIKGHVTDGSNIYQLKIGDTSINVPVNENGWFKWADIKEYKTALETQQLWVNPNNGSLDVIEICINNMTLFRVNTTPSDIATNYSLKIIDFKNSNITITGRAISSYNCVNVEEIKNTKKIKLISTDTRAIRASFYKTVALKNLPYMCNYQFLVEGGEYEMMFSNTITKIDGLIPIVSTALNQFGSLPNLEEILDCAEILYNVSFAKSSKLTAQSVVNLFNAVAADGITLTFHPTVFAMIEQQLEIEGSPIYEAYWNSDYDFNYASA